MSGPVTKAVIESGIIDNDALEQMQRWGLPVEVCSGSAPMSAEEIANKILDAVTSEDAVELRSTDLDIVRQYLSTRQHGKLHVPDDSGKMRSIGVEYCRTRMGEILIPWKSEPLNDLLLDDRTYLKPAGEEKIFFSDVRELFYGDHKVFVACTPVKDA